MLPRVLPIALLALASAASLASDAYGDEILFVDGRAPKTDVTVLNETLEKVEYRDPRIKQPQSYDAPLVRAVKYTSGLPSDLAVARQNLEQEAFETAAKLFEASAAQVRGEREGLKAQCLFMRGEALRRGGMLADAIQAYDDFLAQYPASRYTPEAALARAEAIHDSNPSDTAQARKAFEGLKKFGGRWQSEAEVSLLILDGAGVAEFQRISAAVEGTYPSVANKAKLQIGRAMIRDGKVKEAREFFQKIVDDREQATPEIVAGAYTGLGTALLKEAEQLQSGGKAAEAQALYKDALFHFLRTILQYSSVAAQQPEAMYYAGRCFQRVEGEENPARGKAMHDRLVRQYPDSQWAQRARGGGG